MVELLKSPVNYTGGKFKLLPQLLPLFPSDIDTFVDLFAGGLDVSLNTPAKLKYSNDAASQVIDLYSSVQNWGGHKVHKRIMSLVERYGLSKENQEGYLRLRDAYNFSPTWDKFYALVAHSFSHQIRFNSKGHFNMPFGTDRSCYNDALQGRLQAFVDRLDDTYTFSNLDFRAFDMSVLTPSSFVYCDPPYLITTATYNESGGWTEQDERDLLVLLDRLDAGGFKFGLSNVTELGEKRNEILIEWAQKYIVHRLNFSYSNSNYHKKEENKKNTVEVFVCNYTIQDAALV